MSHTPYTRNTLYIITAIKKVLKTKLHLMIVILRDRKTKEDVRCFACGNTELEARELLKKYRYRWIIENGLKDLVASYYIDEVYGKDPEKELHNSAEL